MTNHIRKIQREKIKVICKKLKCQFPDSPEGMLMFSIVHSAFKDLMYKSERSRAITYLTSDIPHAEIAGVSAGWIKLLLKKSRLLEEFNEERGRREVA